MRRSEWPHYIEDAGGVVRCSITGVDWYVYQEGRLLGWYHVTLQGAHECYTFDNRFICTTADLPGAAVFSPMLVAL